MSNDYDEELHGEFAYFPLRDGKRDELFHILCDDTFDEQTFMLELRVKDPTRRRLATNVMHGLQRLARHRARNENTTVDDAWKDIFNYERLRADQNGIDDKKSKLATRIVDQLGNLADLREEQSPYNVRKRRPHVGKKGGSRAA